MSETDLSLTFSELQSFDNVLSNCQSYILISHKESNSTYKSYAMSFDDLATQLNSKITFALGAAYCASSDFALSSHDHDIYTSVTYEVSSGMDYDILHAKDLTHDETWQLKIKKATNESQEDQEQDWENAIISSLSSNLGVLKLICAKNLDLYSSYFNYTKPEFVGWVYANGSTYALTDFMLSDHIKYVYQHDGTRFAVPILTDMCEIELRMGVQGSYGTQPGQSFLAKHTHALAVAPGATITIPYTAVNTGVKPDFEGMIYGTGYNPSIKKQAKEAEIYPGWHNGKADPETDSSINVDSSKVYKNVLLNTLPLIAEQGTNGDVPYPSHNKMPALVFIGPSRHSDLTGTYVF